jgi:hypothetical protein
MDDNHFLIEWLAYHYHVLNLRNVIVAVDPRSRTSPDHILHRWQTRMNITVYHSDSDYIGGSNATELMEEAESWVRIKFQGDRPSSALVRHRARQRLFYYRCLQEHKRAAGWRSWTLLTDTDEFVRINYESAAALRPNDPTRMMPPPMSEPGSVARLLANELLFHSDPSNNITNSPCIQIPRWRFSNIETDPADVFLVNQQANDPVLLPSTAALFNVSQLATLRWRHHAAPDNYGQNRISKAILDVSRVGWADLAPVDSIHRPVRGHCRRRKLHIRSHQQILLIHHYLGSWEQYRFRRDARAGNERSAAVRVSKIVYTYMREDCILKDSTVVVVAEVRASESSAVLTLFSFSFITLLS